MKVSLVANELLSCETTIETPYGFKQIVYCDYAASGQAVRSIENFIQHSVLPYYANTHSASFNARQMGHYRTEARQIVERCINARTDKDQVLFVGAGVTAGINRLVELLQRYSQFACLTASSFKMKEAVVFVSLMEHHSNLLPWRESGAKVVVIGEDSDGLLDSQELQVQLQEHASAPVRIGSFTAASNITGLVHPIETVTKILHLHGALAIWDFASSVNAIDMNPLDPDLAIDALVVSPHKFIGGPGSSGILAIKKKLLTRNAPPTKPGGGTVFFVTDEHHIYLEDYEHREESGSPDIIASVRTGLTFQFKHSIPLDDIKGIQVRGGCACAGPYAFHLLGLSRALILRYEKILVEDDDNQPLKPGFVRVSFSYANSDEEIEFVLSALEFVAMHAHCFLQLYSVETDGSWLHRSHRQDRPRFWLQQYSLVDEVARKKPTPDSSTVDSFSGLLSAAKELAASWKAPSLHASDVNTIFPSPDTESLRWFVYPDEASIGVDTMLGLSKDDYLDLAVKLRNPIIPRTYSASRIDSKLPSGMNTTDPLVPVESSLRVSESGSITNTGGASLYRKTLNKSSVSAAIRRSRMGASPLPPDKEKKFISRLIFGKALDAIREFGMIEDGDRVLVGLSGGKDSLTLLHMLRQLKRSGIIKFELGATTVDPRTLDYDPSALIPYVESLGIPYFYHGQCLIDLAKEKQPSSICAWCSRMKRGILCKTARDNGYNVLALGQHLDDLVETFFMFAFHNGKLGTMQAKSRLKQGDLSIIRPFVYLRELQTKRYAKLYNLPVISENCPACFAEPKERKRVKALLAAQENLFPALFNSLGACIKPLMKQPEGEYVKEEDFM